MPIISHHHCCCINFKTTHHHHHTTTTTTFCILRLVSWLFIISSCSSMPSAPSLVAKAAFVCRTGAAAGGRTGGRAAGAAAAAAATARVGGGLDKFSSCNRISRSWRRWSSSSSTDNNNEAQASDNNAGEESNLGGGEGAAGKKKEKLRAIRQHVNPLSRNYQQQVELPEGWITQAFTNPSLPFHIDIGSARGRFVVEMAQTFPNLNLLGLEIRRPCVEEAFKKMEKYDVKGNIHFLALNANVDLERVVKQIEEHSEIARYSIQFPDPHFKKKHKKRRMVQPELVTVICRSVKAEGGEILLQSDVEEVATSMREAFAEDPLVEDVCAPGTWMAENPLGVPTEREKLTLGRGDPVYRTVFRRKQ